MPGTPFAGRGPLSIRPTPAVFRKVFNGRGGFVLRYQHPAMHVEGDLSRQVLVLAEDKKPVSKQCPRCKENTPVNEVDVQSPHVVERLAGGETAAVVPAQPLVPGSAEWCVAKLTILTCR